LNAVSFEVSTQTQPETESASVKSVATVDERREIMTKTLPSGG